MRITAKCKDALTVQLTCKLVLDQVILLEEYELPEVEGDLWHLADEEEGDDEEEDHGLPRLLRVRVACVGAASHRVAPPLLDGPEMDDT